MKGIKRGDETSRKERSGDHTYLPIHIWVNIFLRLPSEFIVTVMCVCKEWYRTVTNPSFKNLFLQKSDENHVLYLGKESFGLVSRKTLDVVRNYNYPIKEFNHMDIIGSVNGLLCLSDMRLLSPIFLVNPSIQKYKAISSSAFGSITVDKVAVLGLGYHEPSKDYKIVRFFEPPIDDSDDNDFFYESDSHGGNDKVEVDSDHIEDDELDQVESVSKNQKLEESQVGPDSNVEDDVHYIQTDVEVYSLSTESWKIIDVDEFPWSFCFEDNSSPIVFNERLHWFVYNKLEETIVVLTFHLGLELLKELKLPADYPASSPYISSESIGVLNGRLSVGTYYHNLPVNNHQFSIYMMMEYGVQESWTKMYNFFRPDTIRRCMGFIWYDQVIMENYRKDIILYDITKGEVNQIQILEKRHVVLLQVAAYKESLVLIDDKKPSEVCLCEKCALQQQEACSKLTD